jgi:hypothetical protein
MSQVEIPEDQASCQPPLEMESESAQLRRPYTRPNLMIEGDVRDLTFGGSPGLFDSGSATTQEFPT